jgi:hypothetical protein
MEFTEDEKNLFLRMVDYFIKSEQSEIQELKLPSGNRSFIPECEKRLNVFNSIKDKVKKEFNF